LQSVAAYELAGLALPKCVLSLDVGFIAHDQAICLALTGEQCKIETVADRGAGLSARGGHLDLARLSVFGLVVALWLPPIIAGRFLLYRLSLCFANALAVLSVSMLVR
jgi:hypothetical protein